jgi:hypothetical protein
MWEVRLIKIGDDNVDDAECITRPANTIKCRMHCEAREYNKMQNALRGPRIQ